MGMRDTEEMLEAAKAECVRLEKVIADTREYVDHPGNWSALDGRRGAILALLDGHIVSTKTQPGGNQ